MATCHGVARTVPENRFRFEEASGLCAPHVAPDVNWCGEFTRLGRNVKSRDMWRAMADETPVVADVAPVAPAAVESAAPVVETASATLPSPAASTIEGGTEPAAEAVAEQPQETKDAAPAEAAPEIKAEEPEAVEPVAYEAFTLPEGFQAAPERIEAFTKLIGEHRVPQATAQALIDLHTSELAKYADQTAQRQQDDFTDMRAGWKAQFAKEAGNRHDTMVNDAKWAIMQAVPDKAGQKAIWDAFALTGAGDHPAVIKAWASIAKKLREPAAAAPSVPRRGGGGSAWDNRYGG